MPAPKKKNKTKQRSINEARNDNDKENPTENLKDDNITIMSPVVGNMVLASVGMNNNLDSDMDSTTGEVAFAKAQKIATYQKVVHQLHNEIRGELFTTTTNQPVNSDALQRSYETHCKMNGISDTPTDIKEEVKRVTKKFGWKKYKILHSDDCKWDSEFAELIMGKLGLLGSVEIRDGKYRSNKWDMIKKDVISSMQAVKSSATQSIKRSFLGTYMNKPKVILLNKQKIKYILTSYYLNRII